MKGAIEFLLWIGLASAVHVAVIATTSVPGGLPHPPGSPRDGAITHAAVPDIAQLVVEWDRLPAVVQISAMTLPPVADVAPTAPSRFGREPATATATPLPLVMSSAERRVRVFGAPLRPGSAVRLAVLSPPYISGSLEKIVLMDGSTVRVMALPSLAVPTASLASPVVSVAPVPAVPAPSARAAAPPPPRPRTRATNTPELVRPSEVP